MSGYDLQDYYREDSEQGDREHQIQAYYANDDNIGNRSHRRSNARHDFPYPYSDRYRYHPYEYGNNHWNQGYNVWGTDGHPVNTYYPEGSREAWHNNYEQSWDVNSYAYSGDTYTRRTNSETLHNNKSHRARDFFLAEMFHRSPSPSYLAVSLDPSKQTDPAPRKLLILDLNGTLLFRSLSSQPPHSRRQIKHLKRIVHARPYLPSFREYLFHSSTQQWLDTMIWSSAQPHSVQDMLQQCFPVPEGAESANARFIAVWARDTLGLSSANYSRKIQTIKDLRKPWHELKRDNDSGASARHSAHSTVLLDDSQSKACLQPWNHVCVPEYDATMQAADARTLATELGALNARDAPCAVGASDTSSFPTTTPLDCTLLAVIGILEAMQSESNIASWIRAGGLCVHNAEVMADNGKTSVEFGTEQESAQHPEPKTEAAVQNATPSTSTSWRNRMRDEDNPLTSYPAKRVCKTSPHETKSPSSASTESARSSNRPEGHPPPSTTPLLTPQCQLASSPSPLTPDLRPQRPFDTPSHHSVIPTNTTSNGETQPQWFEHPPTLSHWVERGRTALRALGIAEVAIAGGSLYP